VIAVDEVEHLTIESIDAVRRINDFTGCGVVLVGLPKFYNDLARRQSDYAYVYNRTAMPMKLGKCKKQDLATMAATMFDCAIPDVVLMNVCGGIGRDLRIILLESLRVAADNGVSSSDVAAFSGIIERVSKNLGRKVA
jgi:DNA transposition AAA+ family ATPase